MGQLISAGIDPHSPQLSAAFTACGSPLGALWRDIESYLAANPGLFCFVCLAYPRETSTDVPAEVEYGLWRKGNFAP